jgi:thymidylate kinase
VFAARAAKISYNTFRLHQRNDPEFARQVAEAEEQAVELLHAQCFKAALEGVIEPVYFQGKIVGHTRKFDSRLAIELLRAHMPYTFKAPGSHAAANVNAPGASGIVVTPEVQEELMAMRQETLRRLAEKKAKAITVA